jgi:PPM family protein phosphatase
MVGMLSDVGNFRDVNEDAVGALENDHVRIYVIADGMGGHNAGEVASKLAVDSTIGYIKAQSDYDDLENILISSIKYANKKIYNLALTDKELKGMGTTISACLIFDRNMIVANVGDSSCYVLNKDGITKVTKDHSLVQQLIDEGSITEMEAVSHPNKNIITRALGTNTNVIVDTYKINLKDIYKVILCTDGLTNDVSTDEMYKIVNNNDVLTSCRKLIELSKGKSGRDNISVIVFEGEGNDGR